MKLFTCINQQGLNSHMFTKLTFNHFLINSIRKKPTIRKMHTSLPSIPHTTTKKKQTMITFNLRKKVESNDLS
jgi:hypothetical protein